MSTFELTATWIWLIVFVIPFICLCFFFIAGLVKNQIDKGEKESTGIVGWIIAILITCTIFYALFFADECHFDHFRHT